jgi:hypothetical protein
MRWIIERDEKGEPVRMVWAPGADEYLAQCNREYREAAERNALPMPAMREWAKARGLIQ